MTLFDDDLPVAEALKADLASGDVERRVASASRAGREGGPGCVEPLCRALGDPEPSVRAAAGQALAELAARGEEHGDPPLTAFVSLASKIGAAARDPVPEVRRAALETLEHAVGEEGRSAFQGALADENAGVRIVALRGLARLGGHDAAQAVLRLLGDPDALVRFHAVCAVDELDPPGAAEALCARLTDERVEVAAEAAFCLAERGDARGLDVLCQTLRHRDLGFEAARLLGELGDPRACEALRAYVGRWLADPLTRLQAAASLWRLGERAAEAVLLRGLRSWRRPVRGYAIELCSILGVAKAFEPTLDIARSSKDYHCSTAARALGRYRDPRAVEVLCSLLSTHPDPDVREDAARALGEIGGERAGQALAAAAAEDLDEAVRETARTAARGGA
jgi:HEAT repeat protein